MTHFPCGMGTADDRQDRLACVPGPRHWEVAVLWADSPTPACRAQRGGARVSGDILACVGTEDTVRALIPSPPLGALVPAFSLNPSTGPTVPARL